MIADADPDVRQKVSSRLRNNGYDVIEADDAHHIQAQTMQFTPALILLGIVTLDIDGLETYRQLKSDQRTSAVPVVLLLPEGDQIDHEQDLKLGAAGLLPRPLDFDMLVWRIRAALQRQAISALFSSAALAT